MHTRVRTTGAAGTAALLLVLTLAATALAAPTPEGGAGEGELDPPVVDTTLTWEDLDGDGIDDDCDHAVVADPAAVLASDAAADLDGDGTISVDEAAQTERTGGPECNHGGYVDGVATALGETDEDEDEDPVDEEQPAEPCDTDVLPPFDPAIFNGSGAFGAYVAAVAASDVVGGANCNHGGAVRAAVHAAREAATELRAAEKAARAAERESARAERAAERDAEKAERAAARAAERAERAAQRAAAKAERAGGKGKGKGE